MHTRRTFLGACGATVAAGVAGCADAIPTTFAATPATVPQETLTQTGHTELDTFSETITPADFGVSLEGLPVSADEVEITNEVALYSKESTLGDTETDAVLAGTVSTPRMVIEGRSLSPVGDWDISRVMDEFIPRIEETGQFGNIRDLDEAGEQMAPVLGTDRTVTRFEAVADLQQFEQEVEVVFHATDPITAGRDFVIVAGGYPEALADTEEDALLDLFAGVEHEG